MTLGQIRQRLNRIASSALRGDYDAAHSEEDRLFVEVLRAVADGKAGPTEARAALRSKELIFVRRTA